MQFFCFACFLCFLKQKVTSNCSLYFFFETLFYNTFLLLDVSCFFSLLYFTITPKYFFLKLKYSKNARCLGMLSCPKHVFFLFFHLNFNASLVFFFECKKQELLDTGVTCTENKWNEKTDSENDSENETSIFFSKQNICKTTRVFKFFVFLNSIYFLF